MVIASFVVAVLAVIVSVLTYVDSRRKVSEANDAAARSAAAAERSAQAEERSLALAEAAANKYEVPWSLTRAAGDTFRLTNGSRTETAYEVTVDAVDPRHGGPPHDAPRNAILAPGEAVDFFGLQQYDDVSDTRIAVTWRREPLGPLQGPWMHPTF